MFEFSHIVLLDNIRMLQGEVTCKSLLPVKGLNITVSFQISLHNITRLASDIRTINQKISNWAQMEP